jgi:hypothetical protein
VYKFKLSNRFVASESLNANAGISHACKVLESIKILVKETEQNQFLNTVTFLILQNILIVLKIVWSTKYVMKCAPCPQNCVMLCTVYCSIFLYILVCAYCRNGEHFSALYLLIVSVLLFQMSLIH